MRLLVAVVCLALVAVAGVGCGSSASSEEEWVGEVDKQLKEFKSRGGTVAQEEIVNATTPKQIEGAYLAYATQLRSLKVDLEATEPPEECEALKEEMTQFVGELVTASEKLGNQTELSEADFARIARKQNQASKEFEAELLKVTKGETCAQ